jgi:hypothetical protein
LDELGPFLGFEVYSEVGWAGVGNSHKDSPEEELEGAVAHVQQAWVSVMHITAAGTENRRGRRVEEVLPGRL